MLELDGSEGGGQLVRTAASLAALTGEAFEMTGVRGNRDPTGLRAQHATAVHATATLCDADTTGVSVGSDRVVVDPGDLRGGDFSFDVGTAGSLPLVVDALLPLALRIPERATVELAGGTDVTHAPPLDYLRHVKLPLLRTHGLHAEIDVDRRGFYPAGGGELTLELHPSELSPVELTERGRLTQVVVHSAASKELADAEVAERQVSGVQDGVDLDVPVAENAEYVSTRSTGTVVTVVADYGSHRAGFAALGERGRPAEDVGLAAAAKFRQFAAESGAVDRHLADQLLPYLALAGGRVTTPERTRHLDTCTRLLDAFGFDVGRDDSGDSLTLTGATAEEGRSGRSASDLSR